MTASPGDSIGIDIGGTAIKAARVDGEGRILHAMTLPAGANLTAEALLALVRRALDDLSASGPVRRVGIAVAGVVRTDGLMPAGATNLPALADQHLPDLFSSVLDRSASVINDAQAAMHGEAWSGAARGVANALMVTFGTGLGFGLLLDGRVNRGAHGASGELGAWVPHGAHGDLTIEAIAAPHRFEQRHGRRLGVHGFEHGADPETDAAIGAISRVLAAAHLLLDLELIILAGGITAAGEPFRAVVEAAFRAATPGGLQHDVRLALSALGPYAGAVGAVAPSVPETSA